MGLKKHRKRMLKLARTAARQLGKGWVEKVFRSACELIEEELKGREAAAAREGAKKSPAPRKKAVATSESKAPAPPAAAGARKAKRSAPRRARAAAPAAKPAKPTRRKGRKRIAARRTPRPETVEVPAPDVAPRDEAEVTSAGEPEALPTS